VEDVDASFGAAKLTEKGPGIFKKKISVGLQARDAKQAAGDPNLCITDFDQRTHE
jgi:hypothetical protein